MIKVEFRKHPDTLHWNYEAEVLGEDEWGVWLGVAPGSVLYKGTEERRINGSFVQSVAPDRWWTMVRNNGHRATHYVDVITPAEWIGPEHLVMIDLDLDVVKLVDGTVVIEDEDEFDEHRKALGYPDFWVDKARITTAEIYTALERGAEPFGKASKKWLDDFSGRFEADAG